MKPKIVFSEKCLEYGSWHIESPKRLQIAYKILKEMGYEFVEPEPASEEDLFKVHDANYIQLLKKGAIEDPDTPAYENIYEYARLSAGAAILAAKINGFSLMRPPGHHVGKYGAALGAYTKGFCYINNIAVAVKHLGKPTLILDIDGHHGNGTQEIFLGDPNVVFISLHRYPYYPGTGAYSEANCLNFPLSADCGEAVYLKTLEEALRKIDLEKVEVVAVSTGFDAYAGDLASLSLREESYEKIGKLLAALDKPTFFVLEGGYIGENVGKGIDALLKSFQ
ncbi:MAG: histone deacetylase [Candidatus Bathyarchaeota archaeon]|nr:histone deacetylase [Candidatus Bathyarchaeota archaeon A05DMB-3]MDH7606159.1 histone deacetylase [Candidatus Bathyarchaeota archaeon]